MMEGLNIAVFKYISRFAGVNPALDGIARITAQYSAFVFILWLLYLWIRRGNKCKDIVLYSGYTAILGLLLNLLISSFYYHPRPFMVHMGKLLLQHTPETSFPSDHTTFMLSIAFMLIYFRETKISGLILLILALTGGWARIFCGLHFPMDISGSLGIAWLSSFIIHLLQSKLEVLNKVIVNLLTFRKRISA